MTRHRHTDQTNCVFFLVNIDEKTYSVTPINLTKTFGKDFAKLMNDKLSADNFFTQIEKAVSDLQCKT